MEKEHKYYINIYGVIDTDKGEIVFEGIGPECARFLGIDNRTIYKYVRAGNIVQKKYKVIVVRRGIPTQRAKYISEEDQQKICKQYKEGESKTKIIREWHIGVERLARILEEHGLNSSAVYPDVPAKDLDKGKILALRKALWTFDEIAREMFTNRDNVIEAYREALGVQDGEKKDKG